MNRREKEEQKRLLAKAAERATRITVDIYISSMALMLHDEFGFGKKRIEKALDKLQETIMPLSTGMIGVDYFKQHVQELTGVDLSNEE